MLTRWIESKISAEERSLGENLDYLKYILRSSRPAFLRYVQIWPMANFGRVLPVEALHTADLVASRYEGCDNCVRVESSHARRSGVPCDVIAAVLSGNTAEMSRTVRDVYEFTMAILRDEPHQSALRARIVDRYGDAALVELGLRIASSRVFPVMTRTLGFASRSTWVDTGSPPCTRLDDKSVS